MTQYDPGRVMGWHAPNRRISEVEGGAGAFWGRVGLSGGAWVKLLYPDHSVDDAIAARKRGVGVILRAPGEGFVDWHVVLDMIGTFKGHAQLIELGNEPSHGGPAPLASALLEKHLDAMEAIADNCLYAAFRSNVLLCTPGWDSAAEPPDALANSVALRWWNVYNRFPRIAAHCYGSVNFDGQLKRVARWQECWRKTTYITEAGIAAKDLISAPPDPAHYDASQSIKAERYGTFVRQAAAQGVPAVCFFIDRGSTPEWGSFNTAGQYDPHGTNSYWLTDQALSVVRDYLGE